MIRTGIFGGSFNPIHHGHIGLAQHILAQQLVDEVWLMVSPQNPLKQQTDLINEDIRLTMAQKAVEHIHGIEACDFEFRLPRPSYTWNTLQKLEEQYPQRKFSLIIGADNWLVFHRWAHHEDLLQRYPILIYPREGSNVDRTALPNNAMLLDTPLFPYSSTEIRERLAAGEFPADLIPDTVAEILRKM